MCVHSKYKPYFGKGSMENLLSEQTLFHIITVGTQTEIITAWQRLNGPMMYAVAVPIGIMVNTYIAPTRLVFWKLITRIFS